MVIEADRTLDGVSLNISDGGPGFPLTNAPQCWTDLSGLIRPLANRVLGLASASRQRSQNGAGRTLSCRTISQDCAPRFGFVVAPTCANSLSAQLLNEKGVARVKFCHEQMRCRVAVAGLAFVGIFQIGP